MGLLKNFFGSGEGERPGKIVTVYDDSFEAEVLKSDIPVVVDFWATWCMPCQVMGGLMSELAREYAGHVKVCKINVDECRATAQTYNIRSIPTIILFKNGKPLEQITGLVPKNGLIERFERFCLAKEETDNSASHSGN